MSGPGTSTVAYAQTIGRFLMLFAVLAAAAAPLLEEAARYSVWINAVALLGYLVLERSAARIWHGRLLSLLRVTFFIAAAGPFFLIIGTFLQGDATYANMTGRYRHSTDAGLVALAGFVLHAAALGGAILAGRWPSMASRGAEDLARGYSIWFFRLVGWLVVVYAILRLTVLFLLQELPPVVTYGARLYLSYFMPIFILLGYALRVRMESARLAAIVAVATSALVLLSGGRSDALYPIIFLSAGYVLARPVERGALVRWTSIAVPLFFLAMYAGGLVREDERGRTGEAVIARVEDWSSTIAGGGNRSSAVEVTVGRLISNSTHSVITRIPAEFPFEVDGLSKLPAEALSRVLPRFNLQGTSETEQPRNWMLNDLGFLVNWATSVELTLVADAWYRGGFAGLVVVGLTLGLMLQLLENVVYVSMQRRSVNSAILVFVAPWLLTIEARDIVDALRTMLFASMAGLMMVIAARSLGLRKTGSWRPTGRGASSPRPASLQAPSP